MRTTSLIAIILIAVGIVAYGYQGISCTTTEKFVDLGPLKITADRTRAITLPPIVGAISLAGGVLLLAGRRKD